MQRLKRSALVAFYWGSSLECSQGHRAAPFYWLWEALSLQPLPFAALALPLLRRFLPVGSRNTEG